MTTCAQGAFGKMAVLSGSGPYTWSGGTRLKYFRENIKKKGRIEHPDVILGTRFEDAERARFGPNLYVGIATLPVNPAELVTWLPLILGGTAVGTTFPLAETIPTFGALFSKVTRVFEYGAGAVNRCLIRGQQNGPEGRPNWITMALELWFKSETPDVTFPSALELPKTADYTDFVFEDSTLTMQAVARKPKWWELLIHNHLEPRYVNSLDPVAFCPSRSTIALRSLFPYDDDHDDLHGLPLAGAAGSLTLTNGPISTTFNFAALQSPDETPEVPGKTEIDQPVVAIARKNGATASLEVINDSTP